MRLIWLRSRVMQALDAGLGASAREPVRSGTGSMTVDISNGHATLHPGKSLCIGSSASLDIFSMLWETVRSYATLKVLLPLCAAIRGASCRPP